MAKLIWSTMTRGGIHNWLWNIMCASRFSIGGYRYATVVIPAHGDESGERTDVISDVKAITINVEDGRLVTVPLEKDQLFKEEVSRYLTQTKFTFPNLQDGSIIEYSYQLRSPHIFNFHTWHL